MPPHVIDAAVYSDNSLRELGCEPQQGDGALMPTAEEAVKRHIVHLAREHPEREDHHARAVEFRNSLQLGPSHFNRLLAAVANEQRERADRLGSRQHEPRATIWCVPF
jgi:hypothetical protein